MVKAKIIVTKQDVKELKKFFLFQAKLLKLTKKELAKHGLYLEDSLLYEIISNSLSLYFTVKKKRKNFMFELVE